MYARPLAPSLYISQNRRPASRSAFFTLLIALIWLPLTWATYTRPSAPVRRPLAPNKRLGGVKRCSVQPAATEDGWEEA